MRLLPLTEQVIVITGASSGMGLCTAKLAAERGARVVLVARNEADLARAVLEIEDKGGRAVFCAADVSDPAALASAADCAIDEYGQIDTWINNAGVSIYGRLMEVELEEMRRQFDVNFWGTVHGSRTAVKHLERRGGALINVASALADRAIPMQGVYCATKHAMKAFTDALRMELEAEGAPISVTLVKPGSMNTPLFQKARTLEGAEPQPIAPVYAPEVCARAILECAVEPKRDVTVGGMGRVLSLLGTLAPRRTDKFMEKKTLESQLSDVPVKEDREDNLYCAVESDGGEQGRNWTGHTRKTSLYTWAALHPGRAALAAAIFGTALAGGVTALKKR